jgi:hypothetical protein
MKRAKQPTPEMVEEARLSFVRKFGHESETTDERAYCYYLVRARFTMDIVAALPSEKLAA